MRARNESTRVLEIGEASLLCFYLDKWHPVTEKMLKNVRNWQMLIFFSISSGQRKYVLCRGNVRTRAVYAIDCSLCSPQFSLLPVTPEYVQFFSKEVLARLNWSPWYLHSHNIRRVVLTLRRDVESSETKHHKRRRMFASSWVFIDKSKSSSRRYSQHWFPALVSTFPIQELSFWRN